MGMILAPQLLANARGFNPNKDTSALVFNSATSRSLTRTSGGGDRQKFTIEGAIRRTKLGTIQTIYGANNGSGGDLDRFNFRFLASDQIAVTGQSNTWFTTNAVFRDTSGVYHFKLDVDTTQTNSVDRVTLLINNVEMSGTHGSSPTLNGNTCVNQSGVVQGIGVLGNSGVVYGDFILSYIRIFDGINPANSTLVKFGSRGQLSEILTPVLFGAEGSWLEFSDNSIVVALGTDTSGNGNDWTVTNFAIADQVSDTWSNNYCTLNPLVTYGGSPTLTDGALTLTANDQYSLGTILIPPRGKWCFEVKRESGTGNMLVGIGDAVASDTGSNINTAQHRMYASDGNKITSTGASAYGDTVAVGEFVMILVNMDDGEISFILEDVDQGVAFTDLISSGKTWVSKVQMGNASGVAIANFGQKAFHNAVPVGYKPLNTANLPKPPVPDGATAFGILTWTGNGTSQNVTGLDFDPDLMIIKNRSAAFGHVVVDRLRGATKNMLTDTTGTETTDATRVSAFITGGFTVGSSSATNGNGNQMIAWCYKMANATKILAKPTCERASSKWTFGENGFLVEYTTDEIAYDWNPATGDYLGILANEGSGTNYVLHSDETANAAWTKTRATVSSNAITDIYGSTTGEKIVEDNTAAASHYVFSAGISVTSGEQWCQWGIFKAAERNFVWLDFSDTYFGSSSICFFDLSNGTVSSMQGGIDSAGVIDLGDGRYLCWAVDTATATGTANAVFGPAAINGVTAYNGDGSSGIYVLAVQMEKSNFPTSYMPSGASPGTRAAERIHLELDSWFNAAAGTLAVTVRTNGETSPLSNGQFPASLNDETFNQFIGFDRTTAGALQAYVNDGGTTQFYSGVGPIIAADTECSMAIAFTANDFAASFNGGSVTTDLSGTVPTVTRLTIGDRDDLAYPWKGHIKEIAYYPERKSNVELQQLSNGNLIPGGWRLSEIGKSGTLPATVRPNPLAGQSIYTWTATGGAGQSVGHGLEGSPELIIHKSRTYATSSWAVWYKSFTSLQYLLLDTTSAVATITDYWPGQDVNTVSLPSSANNYFPNRGDMLGIAFRSVEGSSKIDTYTGNGSTNGRFVYCGFKPRYILLKRTDGVGPWTIIDTARNPYNEAVNYLFADTNGAESTANLVDVLANGFKLRTSAADQNASGGTYIFVAFAEVPFGGKNFAPANAF